jgi:penicillin-binding protein 1A
MTLRSGLVYSKNTITAQVMEKIGAERVVRLAQAMGVRASKLDPVLSLALGTSPVTLREMVTAYAVIANGGQLVEPMVITRVEDRRGRVLVEFQAKRETVDALPRPHALELVNFMRGVIDQGTGTAIRYRYGITADVAGKTGTTQENTDGWFIMMHPQLVAGARVGFNSKLTMGSWGQGARSALPIVGEVFQQALRTSAIDQRAEFPIARAQPRPPAEPEELGGEPGAAPGAELPPDLQPPPAQPQPLQQAQPQPFTQQPLPYAQPQPQPPAQQPQAAPQPQPQPPAQQPQAPPQPQPQPPAQQPQAPPPPPQLQPQPPPPPPPQLQPQPAPPPQLPSQPPPQQPRPLEPPSAAPAPSTGGVDESRTIAR